MLLARSFILAGGSRAALAVLLVAMSVAYALLSGAAAGGLRDASEALSSDLVHPQRLGYAPGLEPFDAAAAPAGSKVLVHAREGDVVWGTVRPWPYGAEVVPGPYVRAGPERLAAAGLPVGPPRAEAHAPWDWALLPPDRFDARFPELADQATLVVPPPDALSDLPGEAAPAAGAFYEGGATQVAASLHLVVAAMGLSMAVFSAGVLRLEILAREKDLATVEAIGGLDAARRAVVLRALVLTAAGVLAGIGGGLLLVRASGRSLGGQVPGWSFVLEVAVVAFVAGSAAGILGGLHHLRPALAERLGRRGPAVRRFPGPVRFLLVTPRLFPAAVASALVLASVSGVVLAATAIPWTLFQPQDGTVVIGQAADNPFRGSADRFFGEHAALLPGVAAASPETIAPTLLEGRPVIVRGVMSGGWRLLEQPRLIEGEWPDAASEATVGTRLARAVGLAPGDVVTVPGAYRATVRALIVVGVHADAGLADDEIVTDLDAAGDLAGIPGGQVHLVRLRVAPAHLEDALAASGAPIVRGLRIVPAEPVPLTQAEAVVDLVNLSPEAQSRALLLRIDNATVASTVVLVPGHGEASVSIPFIVPVEEQFHVQVNPELDVTTRDGGLRIEGPETVEANTTFGVRVVTTEGAPASGASLEAEGLAQTADGDGRAIIPAGRPGIIDLRARLGQREAGRSVFVVDRAWALSPHVEATAANRLASSAAGGEARHDLLVAFANLGGAPFDGKVEARWNDTLLASFDLRLAPRERTALPVTLVVPAGGAVVDVAGLAVALPAVGAPTGPPGPTPAPAPIPSPPPDAAVPEVLTIEGLLEERRRAAEQGRREARISAKAFVEDVFEDFEQGVRMVLLATFVQAGAGIAVAVLREGRERGEVLRILGDLGATPDQLAARGAREAVLASLGPLALGTGLAALGLVIAEPFGFPAAFGHTLPASPDLGIALYAIASLSLLAGIAGAWVGRIPPEEPPRQVARESLASLLGAGR